MKQVLWSLCVCLAGAAFGQGTLVPPDDWPIRERPWGGFILDSHAINVDIKDAASETRVEQVFFNPNPYPLEAVYLFPVPAGASISRLTMTDGDKLMEAKILPADEARRIYESIVRRQRDPALLEMLGSRLVRLRIFPIPPNGKRKISLRYSEVLPRDGGAYRFSYPMSLDARSQKLPSRVTLHADIETSQPIQTVYSPSHADISVRTTSAKHAVVSWESGGRSEPQDFQLLIRSGSDELGLSILPYRSGADGYFLMVLSPQLHSKEAEVSKSIVFVFDRTGSMDGDKIIQAKKALRQCVDRLRPMDRFQVIVFNDGVDKVFQGLVSADEQNKSKAIRFVDDISARGGTNIYEALQAGINTFPKEKGHEFQAIIFLTDGLPTVGETDPQRIRRGISDLNERAGGIRIYSFGVGSDVDSKLLDRIAFDARGDSNYVLEGDKIDTIVEGFFEKVSVPALSNISIKYDGMDVYDVFPKEPRDLFRGSALVIAGRYRGDGHGRITVTGAAARGQDRTFIDVDLSGRQDRDDYIPRVWAARKIGYLMDEFRLDGRDTKELRDEIVRLSLEFGIVTQLTSFLITEHQMPMDYYGRAGHASGELNDDLNGAFIQFGQSDGAAEAGKLKSLGGGGTGGGSGGFPQGTYRGAAPPGREAQALMRIAGDKTFYWVNGVWTDAAFKKEAKVTKIKAFSDAHIKLIEAWKKFKDYSKLGESLIVQLPGGAVQIGEQGSESLSAGELSGLLGK